MKIMDYKNVSCAELQKNAPRRQSLIRRTRKLLHVLRLLSVGRLGRRRASRRARQADRRFLESRTAEEAAFLGKVLSSAHVMAKGSQLLEPLCNGNDVISSEQIVNTIHQAKVSALSVAWRDHVLYLKDELEAAKHKYSSLQDQFNELRSTYLKEVAALRDDVRVRGDAERAIGHGKMKDVTFFFDPMKALQPHELNFALQVVDEKIRMIFEANPSVTPTINFGQIERLQDLRASSEVAKLKEQLRNKATDMHEIEKDRRNLQKELAIASRNKQRPTLKLSAGAPTEVQCQDTRPLTPTSLGTESMLVKFEKKIHALQLERQETQKEIQYHKDQQAQAEADLASCHAELRAALEGMSLVEAREAVLKDKLQFQETHGHSLHDDNEALRKACSRWEARPLKYEIGIGASRKVSRPDKAAKRQDSNVDAETGRAWPDQNTSGGSVDSSCESDEEHRDVPRGKKQMLKQIADLQLENQRLHAALEQQAQAIAQHSAEMDLQQAKVFAGMFQSFEENSESVKRIKDLFNDEAASLSTTLDASLGPSDTCSEFASQFSTHLHGSDMLKAWNPGKSSKPQDDSTAVEVQLSEVDSFLEDNLNSSVAWKQPSHDVITSGNTEILKGELRRLDAGSIDADSRHRATPETVPADTTSHVEQSRQALGSNASLAITRLRRSITHAEDVTQQLETKVALVDGSCQTSPCARLASEAVSAVNRIHAEFDAMCGVTAHVAAALQSTAEENVQARTGVAYVNKEIRHAKAALEGSPALQTDVQLQRCLVNVQHVERATAVNNVEGAFGRLWDDALRRQGRRHVRQSNTEAMLRPDTMMPAQTLVHQPRWHQTASPSSVSVLHFGTPAGRDLPQELGSNGLEMSMDEHDQTRPAALSPSPQTRRASLSPSPPPASKTANRPTSVRRRHSAPTSTETANQQPSQHLQLPDAAHSQSRIAAGALSSTSRNAPSQQNRAELVARIGIPGMPLIIRSASPSPCVSMTSTPVRSPAVTPMLSRSASPDQHNPERSSSPFQSARRPRTVPALGASPRPLSNAARSGHKSFQSVDPLHAAALESGSVDPRRSHALHPCEGAQVSKDASLHAPRRPSTAKQSVKGEFQPQTC